MMLRAGNPLAAGYISEKSPINADFFRLLYPPVANLARSVAIMLDNHAFITVYRSKIVYQRLRLGFRVVWSGMTII